MVRTLAILCALVIVPAIAGCPAAQSTGRVTRGGGSHSSGDDDDDHHDDHASHDDDDHVASHHDDEDPDDLESDDHDEPDAGTSTAASTPPGESPWGQPETQTGAPLPPRHEMSGTAREAYRRGVEAGQRGDTAAARRAFEEALRADGNAFRAAYNLGVLADREGNPDGALTSYRQSMRIQPDYERAAEGIVTIYVRRGQASEAVSFMEPLARQWARNLHIQAVYGEALIAANRPEDAITAARAALRRDERFVPAMLVLIKANLRLERTELAESIMEQAIAIDPNNAELQFLHGQRQQEAGQLALALASYRRAVQLRPDYADARMALALHLLAGGNYDEAVQQFEAVSRLVADQPEVHLGLGNAYRATKQWTKSKNELDRVLAVSPRSAEAHFAMGLLYLEAGENFPGSDLIASLQRAQQEFQAYREIMASRLPPNDPVGGYLEEITRSIEREQRRRERDAARAAKAAERAARDAARDAGTGGGGGGGGGEESGGGGGG